MAFFIDQIGKDQSLKHSTLMKGQQEASLAHWWLRKPEQPLQTATE